MSDFEEAQLWRLLPTLRNRLDISCGTGYYLSKFPDNNRCGMDFSVAMLAQAELSNTQNCSFWLHNFRLSKEEWAGKWDLVSCMWGAYCYVQSVTEIDMVVNNLVQWTRPGGDLFIPVLDIESLRDNLTFAYEQPVQLYGGRSKIKAVAWTWEEDEWQLSHDMLSPTLDYLLELVFPWFEKIELVMCPHVEKGARRILVAKGRLTTPGLRPATLVVNEEYRKRATIQTPMAALKIWPLMRKASGQLKKLLKRVFFFAV